MKPTPLPCVVINRLEAINCSPLPQAVLAKIAADFSTAMAEAEAEIAKGITEETVARDFRQVYCPRKNRSNQPELPFMNDDKVGAV